MRDRLSSLIRKAQKTLYVYVQSVHDPSTLALLQRAFDSGIDVNLCVSDGNGI